MSSRREEPTPSGRTAARGRHEAPVTASRGKKGKRTSTRRSRTTAANQTPKRRRPSKSFLVVLAILMVGTTVLLGGRWLLRQPFFRVQTVRIVGATHELRTDVLRVTGLNRHPELYGLSATSLERSLSIFPWVTSAQVTVRWPHTVTITVHETHAVAVTSFHAAWAYVGANGANLGPAPATADVPTLVDPAAGAAWPYGGQGAAAVTIAATLPPAFAAQVRTINVDHRGAVSLGMTTPVLFVVGDSSNITAKFTAIASVLKSSTLTPGDVVNVTVPDELTVTSPSTG